MNLIVCLEERNGMSFFGKRLSRDAKICEKMVSFVGNNKLFLTPYSAKIFESLPDNFIISENPLESAEQDDFCFVETQDISCFTNDINTIVVYKFCRTYPYDKTFDTNLLEARKLAFTTEFAGNSHDKIIEEVYVL